MTNTNLSHLSRNLFGYGNGATNGSGKSGPKIDKILNRYRREEKRKIAEMEKEKRRIEDLQTLKSMYNGTFVGPIKEVKSLEMSITGNVRKPRQKKTAIDPKVLANISNIDVATVEKALKAFLDRNLKEVVLLIGENGKTVTLNDVMKVLESTC